MRNIMKKSQMIADRIAVAKSGIYGAWRTSHDSGATPEFDENLVVKMLSEMTAEQLANAGKTADLFAEYTGFDFPAFVPYSDDPFDGGEWVYSEHLIVTDPAGKPVVFAYNTHSEMVAAHEEAIQYAEKSGTDKVVCHSLRGVKYTLYRKNGWQDYHSC